VGTWDLGLGACCRDKKMEGTGSGQVWLGEISLSPRLVGKFFIPDHFSECKHYFRACQVFFGPAPAPPERASAAAKPGDVGATPCGRPCSADLRSGATTRGRPYMGRGFHS
jgi:hypothetical protein